ncbi:hypothetical protein [Ktedonospora formicarum]|uniref:Uncharacterized protein n=1 Tax=Ktedonospora formicarum TaxID=2778364 RepID=A0A8J3HVY7_9CHLR|nr:hypothetical protein [Ktedonospora formicarum]GHO45077.1 hypothetical protein KSX_32400 [Ktedonospora formicarum]
MSRFEVFMRHYISTRVGKAVGGGIILGFGVLIFLGQQSLGVFVGAIGLIVLIWSLLAEPSEPDDEAADSSPQMHQPNVVQMPEMPVGQQPPSIGQFPMPSGQLPFSAPQAGIDYSQPQYVASGNNPQAAQPASVFLSDGYMGSQRQGHDASRSQGLFARYGHTSAPQAGAYMQQDRYGQ